MDETEFDDVEVQRILERAAEQQEAAERRSLARGAGTSLNSLRKIAGEVGIEPRFVDAAAREVALRRDQQPAREFMGVPDELRVQRVLPEKVDDEEWVRIVDDLRATYGMAGHVSHYGRVREWQSGTSSASGAASVIHLRLEDTDDGTALSLSQNIRQQTQLPKVLGGTFGGLGVAFLALLPVVDSVPALLAFAGLNVLAGAGILFGGMNWAGRWASRRLERFQASADRVELVAGPSERGG